MSAVDNTAPVAAAAAGATSSSFQSIAILVLFIAVLACLPWLLRRWQKRQLSGKGGQGVQMQVVSTLPLSPSQRVVVVEVGQGSEHTRLVLGVTAQNIQCLHVLGSHPTGAVAPATSFASTMHSVQHGDAAHAVAPSSTAGNGS